MTQRFTSDRPTFDEIQAARKPRTLSEWVPLDGDLLREIDELQREIRVAEREDERLNRDPVAPGLRSRLAALEDDARTAAVRFTFRALPRREWRDLIAEHPSDDKAWRWDQDTFPAAAITACCVEPEGVDGQAIWDDWDEATAKLLGDMAVAVNEVLPKVPFSLTSTMPTNGSGSSSTTAPPGESPTASS